MSRNIAVVRDTLDVEQLAKFLLTRQLSGAAVSDASGLLVGYVSLVALVRERYLEGETEAAVPRRSQTPEALLADGRGIDFRAGSHLVRAPSTVREIMAPHVLRLAADSPIDQAAAVMAHERIHQLLIVSSTGRAVGTVTSLDLLRWVANRDGYAVPIGCAATLPSAFEYAFRSAGRDDGDSGLGVRHP